MGGAVDARAAPGVAFRPFTLRGGLTQWTNDALALGRRSLPRSASAAPAQFSVDGAQARSPARPRTRTGRHPRPHVGGAQGQSVLTVKWAVRNAGAKAENVQFAL